MSIKIEVKSEVVKTVKGTKGDNAGKIFHIPEIHGYAAISGERNPMPILLGIPAPKGKDDRTGHYDQGVYRLGPSSFYVANRELRLRDHVDLIAADAPANDLLLRVTVHGTKTATKKDGTIVTVLDCDVHIPSESYPLSCYIEPRNDNTKPGEYAIGPESFLVESRRLKFAQKPQLLPLAKAA